MVVVLFLFGAAPSASLKASAKRYRFAKLYKMRVETLMNYRSGRAVSGLAGLLGPSLFSLRSKSLVWPAATLVHPSACGPDGPIEPHRTKKKEIFFPL